MRFRRFQDLQDGSDQLLYLSLRPWQPLRLHGRPRVSTPSMQQEQRPSPQSQSIITSNSLFSLTLTVSIRDRTRKRSPPGSQKCQTLPSCPRSRQTIESRSSLSVRSIHPCRSSPPEVLKGKSSCLHHGCFVFMFCLKGEKKRSVEKRPFTSLIREVSATRSRVFICEFYRLRFIYDKLYC